MMEAAHTGAADRVARGPLAVTVIKHTYPHVNGDLFVIPLQLCFI
jgi:hypothetical protein